MHLLKLVFSVFILWMADKYFPLSVLFICFEAYLQTSWIWIAPALWLDFAKYSTNLL